MTKLSRKPISSEKIGHYINNLWSVFTLAESKEEVRALFRDLFTHTEYKMFAKRFEIAKRLLSNERYEDIMQEVRVSEKTIAHVSNILFDRGDGFRSAVIKLARLEDKIQVSKKRYQDMAERRIRRKIPGETILPELIKHGVNKLGETYTKMNKRKSAIKELKN